MNSKYTVEVMKSHPNQYDDGECIIEPFETNNLKKAKQVYSRLYKEYKADDVEVSWFELQEGTYFCKLYNGEGIRQ